MRAWLHGPSDGTGTARTAPVLTLRFAYEARHRGTGELLRDWVRDLGVAGWDRHSRSWQVTSLIPADPDAHLRTAGFAQVLDAEWLTVQLATHRTVLLEPDWPAAAFVAVHPRMVPVELVRPFLPESALWQQSRHRWVVPAHAGLGLLHPAHWSIPVRIEATADQLDTGCTPPPGVGTDGTFDALAGVPVTVLDQVDSYTATSMAKVGITSLADLLSTVPRRYIDRSNPVAVAGTQSGQEVAFLARVTKVSAPKGSARGKGVTTIGVADTDGTQVTCRWFNAPWVARRFHTGVDVLVFGRMETWSARGGGTGYGMTNPLMDPLTSADAAGGPAGLIPIYPASAKADLTTWAMRRAVTEAIEKVGKLTDPLPADIRTARDLVDLHTAYSHVHAPGSPQQAQSARTRLAYDELLRLHLALRMTPVGTTPPVGVVHRSAATLVAALRARLPFAFTGAQDRVLGEIAADLARPTPMHRLLQGEVGSGKTVVALGAALMAIESGQQVALMAPTEILATQHYQEVAEHLDGLTAAGRRVNVELLTTKVTGTRRKQVLAGLAGGSVDLVVGTHALLSKGVDFAGLSLIVVDEQHRFGVTQRHQLRTPRPGDGATPGLLVMTATPAPRTAAMIAFGDLDVSVLDEVPPGREPVATHLTWDCASATGTVWGRVRAEVTAGRQAFVVAPLVGDSELKAARGATDLAGHLAALMPDLSFGVAHGKQNGEERAQVMSAFAAGEIDVLVATTVIEVGVNVPNATVMVVTGAEHFGLTQLHQLRGRVGRGAHPGTCFLVPSKPQDELGETALERMGALVASGDGFALAEVDLALRGPGRVLGGVQAGHATDLVVADLLTDADLVAAAGADAAAMLAADPHLARRPTLRATVLRALGDEAGQWLRSA